MPNLLALECSTHACSVALLHDDDIREIFEICPRGHHQKLLPTLLELLAEAKLDVKQIDAIAYGAGPGSFTGLRLCCGVVQGLGFAANKPVIPVSSLAATTLSFIEDASLAGKSEYKNQPVLVAIDARQGECYFGAYIQSGSIENSSIGPLVVPLIEDKLLALADLASEVKILEAQYEKALCIGDGWIADDKGSGIKNKGERENYPHAKSVLKLALLDYHQGKVLTAEEALPVYLRESVGWKKWQPKAGRV